jgi:hypothetical protein
VNDSAPDDNDATKVSDRLTNRNLRMLGIGYIIAWINTTFYKESQETDKYLKLQLIDNFIRAHNISLKRALENHFTFLGKLPDPAVYSLLDELGISIEIKINNEKTKKAEKRNA